MKNTKRTLRFLTTRDVCLYVMLSCADAGVCTLEGADWCSFKVEFVWHDQRERAVCRG